MTLIWNRKLKIKYLSELKQMKELVFFENSHCIIEKYKMYFVLKSFYFSLFFILLNKYRECNKIFESSEHMNTMLFANM